MSDTLNTENETTNDGTKLRQGEQRRNEKISRVKRLNEIKIAPFEISFP